MYTAQHAAGTLTTAEASAQHVVASPNVAQPNALRLLSNNKVRLDLGDPWIRRVWLAHLATPGFVGALCTDSGPLGCQAEEWWRWRWQSRRRSLLS